MKKLVIVGCGRLAGIVSDAVVNGLLPEYDLVGVYSRTAEKAERIAGDTALGQRIDAETATRVAEVKRLDGRVDQLNHRLDRVETTANRGIAISLAAQQAVPSIQPGQVALFGGVGHYEGETAGSIGVVTAFTDRLSASGAFGFAGGNEFGGRVGVAYVFGGK